MRSFIFILGGAIIGWMLGCAINFSYNVAYDLGYAAGQKYGYDLATRVFPDTDLPAPPAPVKQP